MRSTIFTKTFVLALLTAMPAKAEDDALSGCWSRTYSDAHLNSQPAQVVRTITVHFGGWGTDNSRWADLQVVTANQGHAAKSGMGDRTIGQSLICFRPNGKSDPVTCAVECDGGSAEMVLRADGRLDLVTSYLMVGEVEGCGGSMDIAEVVGQSVTYRLSRATGDECSGW